MSDFRLVVNFNYVSSPKFVLNQKVRRLRYQSFEVLKLSDKIAQGIIFYRTSCTTDCLQMLYKLCQNWISVPKYSASADNSVALCLKAPPLIIGKLSISDSQYAINSTRRSTNHGERATERRQWRQSSMTSIISNQLNWNNNIWNDNPCLIYGVWRRIENYFRL